MIEMDFTIIGGGIIGLMLAYDLRERFPNKTITLFEKRPFLGEMATSRNSGVLHTGIYYPYGSLKREYCIEGNQRWRELCSRLDVSINECGKFLVSTTRQENQELEELFENAIRNKVQGLSWCSDKELFELRDFINAEKAFFSKTTAVLDIAEVLRKLERINEKNGVYIFKSNEILNSSLSGSGGFIIESQREEFQTEYLFNCAGAEAISLRSSLGLLDIENYWVKGNYLKLNRDFYCDSLIYPIPDKEMKGLGIHTSFGPDKKVRFGPNTEDVQALDFSMNSRIIDEMIAPIQKIFKGINKEDLSLDYSGVRSKIKRDGEILTDFLIQTEKEHKIKNYIEFLGIDSPGLTSAPAISKKIVNSLS